MNSSTKQILDYTPDPNKFDLRTHVWDTQGRLVKKNTYRAFIVDGKQVFERPVNSGNLWYENNQPAGRVECEFNERGHIVSKKFDYTAPHRDYKAPLVGDAKLHYELEQMRERNEALTAELAAIKGEQNAKTPTKPSASADAVKTSPPTLTKKAPQP